MGAQNRYKNLTREDYENISDPSWPSFDEFCLQINVPDLVYEEIDQMLDLTEFAHPSFCILPFYGIEYPSKTFCCLVPPGTDREIIKNKIFSGQRDPACKKCWKLEDNGIRSDRLIKNESYDFYHNVSTKHLYKELEKDPKTRPTHVKIDSDNTCNATCVTCGPGSSTAWGNLSKEKDNNYPVWSLRDTLPDLDYSGLKSIIFRGGEPFLSKNNFSILQSLVDHNNTDCVVSFVTNGSIWPTDSQLELMMKFKKLIISLSIDGIGPVFEYLRYPLKWSTIVEYLDRWKKLNIQVGVSYTVSNLNIYYHNQTQAWFNENGLNFLTNPVTDPDYFSINSLPIEVKNKIQQQLIDPGMRSLIRSHDPNDDLLFDMFKKEIARQDRIKDISISAFLPELADLIKNNGAS